MSVETKPNQPPTPRQKDNNLIKSLLGKQVSSKSCLPPFQVNLVRLESQQGRSTQIQSPVCVFARFCFACRIANQKGQASNKQSAHQPKPGD